MQNPESSNTPPDLSKGTPPTPPNNPYQAPNAPPTPPPISSPNEASGATGPISPIPPRNTANPVSTDVIGQSWEVLKPQIGMWIVALLIVGAISGVLNVFSTLLSLAGGEEPSAAIGVVSILISIAGVLLGWLLAAAQVKLALHHIRTGQVDIAKLFDITDVIVPVLIGAFVVFIATVLGFLLLIVPGVIMSLGFSMYMPLIVDQKLDAIAAIKRSWETCKPHLGALFVLFLLLFLLNFATICTCGLGLLVTYPMTQIAIALTYRNLFGLSGEAGTMPPQSPFAPVVAPQ